MLRKCLVIFLLMWSATMHASYEDFKCFFQGKAEDELVWQMLYEQFFTGISPSSKPTLIAIGGGPGSGKTLFRRSLNLTNVHVHDLDEVMIRLPGYQADLQTLGAKQAFENWWPTAQKMAQILVQYAIESGYSIVYDRTCGSEGSYSDLVRAKKRSYQIRLIGLYVDRETALERILKREQSEGRSVTEAILNEYRARFSALWPHYLKLVDEAILYDTNSSAPQLIFSSNDGVKDAATYQAFLTEGEPFVDVFSQKLFE
jgi:predicted ABC-type ATPase